MTEASHVGHIVDEHTGSGFVFRGNGLYHKGHYQEALEAYKTALERESLPLPRWNIHNRLCATYNKLKDYTNALREANEMIAANPEHPKGHVRKGGVLFFTDDFPGAIEEYRKGLQLMDSALGRGLVEEKLKHNTVKYLHLAEEKVKESS